MEVPVREHLRWQRYGEHNQPAPYAAGACADRRTPDASENAREHRRRPRLRAARLGTTPESVAACAPRKDHRTCTQLSGGLTWG